MRKRHSFLQILLLMSFLPMALAGAPSAVTFVEDRGKFQVLLDGQPVGTEEFSIGRSGKVWLCRGSVDLKIPGAGSASVSSELHLGDDGAPQQYAWTSKGDKKISGGVVFTGSTASLKVQLEGGQPYSQDFQFDSTKVVILDNNLYHHYVVLARLYDWNAKGTQTLSVLIPQDLTPGAITLEWGGTSQVDGAKMDMIRVRSADLEVELYAVGGKLMRLSVPSAKVEVRRE